MTRLSPQERELVEQMRDSAVRDGDYAGAAELDALLRTQDTDAASSGATSAADSHHG